MSEKHIGEVVQVIGPVLDIRFAHDELPPLLNAIEIDNDGAKLVAEVAQQVGDDVVRCIAMNSTDGLVRGAKALDTGGPISVPVGEECLGRVFNLLGDPVDNLPAPEAKERWSIHRQAPSYEEQMPATEILETGIKVVDLICPYAKGDVDMVYACGPRPMLKFVAAAAKEYGVRCEVSMEERMGCGIGACLVCACQLEREGKSVMGHVCKDGPVFPAEEVVW